MLGGVQAICARSSSFVRLELWDGDKVCPSLGPGKTEIATEIPIGIATAITIEITTRMTIAITKEMTTQTTTEIG